MICCKNIISVLGEKPPCRIFNSKTTSWTPAYTICDMMKNIIAQYSREKRHLGLSAGFSGGKPKKEETYEQFYHQLQHR
jgi:hypothetical protein